MKIGLISPSLEELSPLLKYTSDVKNYKYNHLEWFECRFNDKEIVAVVCGICKVNAACAAQMLIDRFNPDAVTLFGVCGAISDALDIGDAVVCSSVCHHDVEEEMLTKNNPYYPSAVFKADDKLLKTAQKALKNLDFKVFYGLNVTGEAFIEDDNREQIKQKLNPLSVDMETAAAAQACALNDKPFIAFRTVTDTPAKRGLTVFRDNLAKAAANCGKVFELFFKELSE